MDRTVSSTQGIGSHCPAAYLSPLASVPFLYNGCRPCEEWMGTTIGFEGFRSPTYPQDPCYVYKTPPTQFCPNCSRLIEQGPVPSSLQIPTPSYKGKSVGKSEIVDKIITWYLQAGFLFGYVVVLVWLFRLGLEEEWFMLGFFAWFFIPVAVYYQIQSVREKRGQERT